MTGRHTFRIGGLHDCLPRLLGDGHTQRGVAPADNRWMRSQRVQIKESVLSWLVRWARLAGTRDFHPALAVLVSPVQNFFLQPYVHFCNIWMFVSPSPSKLGWQSWMCVSKAHINWNRVHSADKSSQGRIKIFFYRHDEPKELTKKGPPSFVLP